MNGSNERVKHDSDLHATLPAPPRAPPAPKEAGRRPTARKNPPHYTVDALWRRQRLVAELDSWEFHGKTRAAFEGDRRRDATLLLAGHRVIRLTWRRLHREPERVAGELRALLGAR